MKHVLVIADLGYGSPYWIDFCENLVFYGYRVTVICPRLTFFQRKYLGVPLKPRFELIQTSNFKMFYRRQQSLPWIIRFAINIFRISNKQNKNTDSHEAWIREAVNVSSQLHKANKFDLVLSTSLPIESHIIANKIKAVYQIPWIADYRDPFTFNHNKTSLPTNDEIAWEKNLLSSADYVTTTSHGFSNSISKVYSGKISIVQNGYRKFYEKGSKRVKFPIRILYPGQIYRNYQDPGIILDTLEKINNGDRYYFQIYFSGVSTGIIKNLCIEKYGSVPKWVKLKKQYSLKKSINLQRNHDILLLLNWEDFDQKGVMQTKLYEYIASGTYILATGGSGVDESSDLIRKSNAGVVLENQEEVESFLTELIEKKEISFERNRTFIETLSRQNQSLIFHKLINSLI